MSLNNKNMLSVISITKEADRVFILWYKYKRVDL